MRLASRFAVLAPFPLAFAALVSAACGSKSNAVGEGGECSVATDCADGLVCIAQKDGTRVCSSDLSSVQKTPPTTPFDAGTRAATVAAGGADGAGDDASASDDDASTEPPDAATE